MFQLLLVHATCIAVALSRHLLTTVKHADDKLANLMRNIMQTEYDPAQDTVPPVDMETVLNPFQLKHVFSDSGDVMRNHRRKSIHKRGLVFQATYNTVSNIHGYTGIFEKGCLNGIGRFSYAQPPSVNNGTIGVIYGFAMKCLLDHEESVNVFAMPASGLNPQNTYNLFEHNYSNQIPRPTSLTWIFTAQSFRMVKYLASRSAKDTDPFWLTLDPMAMALNDNIEYKAPHSIICAASEDIKNLYTSNGQDINKVDFRNVLNGKGKGVKVFDVYAENMEVNAKIGEIYAVSDFVASTFADQELFFQHPL